MSEQESVWYYTQHGERKGPVTLDVLRGAIEHVKIDRQKDLIWGPGLSDWVTLEKVPELQDMSADPPPMTTPIEAEPAAASASTVSPPSAPASGIGSTPAPASGIASAPKSAAAPNPYQSPESTEDDSALADAMAERREVDVNPGMGRFMFWFAPTCIFGVAYLVLFVLLGSIDFKDGTKFLGFVPMSVVAVALIACLFATFSRLKNLGMSRWCVLLYYVPFLNLWLDYRLYICPAGYNVHRKLDLPGKVMIGFVMVLLCGLVGLFCFAGSVMPQAAQGAPAEVVLPAESE